MGSTDPLYTPQDSTYAMGIRRQELYGQPGDTYVPTQSEIDFGSRERAAQLLHDTDKVLRESGNVDHVPSTTLKTLQHGDHLSSFFDPDSPDYYPNRKRAKQLGFGSVEKYMASKTDPSIEPKNPTDLYLRLKRSRKRAQEVMDKMSWAIKK